ncbi:MAG: hypothetical protein PVJ33_02870 [Lysobacterales bacterium]|jgi:hypothetical protein
MNVLDGPTIRNWLFVVVKYTTYGILIRDGYVYFLTEANAAGTTFTAGLTLPEIIQLYSATIDSAFWILLVVLMELETFVIPDGILKKAAVKWTMIGLRAMCYVMIVSTLYGYSAKLAFQADIVPLTSANACDLVGEDYSVLLEMETYTPLTADNCQQLDGKALGRLNGHRIIAPMADLAYARNVAAIDVFNAVAWLGLVILLEVDFWHQLKGTYKGYLLKVSNAMKAVFYATLFGCALAWAFTGEPTDIIDAVLWLFAFFFIEMNLLKWQKETEAA